TSWVYSATGKNFVRTMLAVAQRANRLRVVADQLGCPTSAADLAGTILSIVERLLNQGWQDRYSGIYHAAGAGRATWHDLATASFAAAERYGLAPPAVDAIMTHEWPTRATRPPDSRLDCGKLASVFGLRLPQWQDGLARTVATIFDPGGSGAVQSGAGS